MAVSEQYNCVICFPRFSSNVFFVGLFNWLRLLCSEKQASLCLCEFFLFFFVVFQRSWGPSNCVWGVYVLSVWLLQGVLSWTERAVSQVNEWLQQHRKRSFTHTGFFSFSLKKKKKNRYTVRKCVAFGAFPKRSTTVAFHSLILFWYSSPILHSSSIHQSFLFRLWTSLIWNADWLAQLIEQRTTVRKVAGSNTRPDQRSGSLNNWGERAAFVMTSANSY